MKNILRELSRDLPEINFITALLSESDLKNLIDELDIKIILMEKASLRVLYKMLKI